ncbi:MAG: aspartate aminotransferase family protein [Christensenellales bacterium]
MNVFETDRNYIAGTYSRFPVEIVKGEGARLYDAQGKAYIDMGSGIAVNLFGASDEVWKRAVIEQLDQIAHTSNLYYTRPGARLAQMLCERTGFKRVFFSNSGAEANECAIKTARKWASDTYGTGHSTIITLRGSFHGRTIATISATGQDSFHTHFGPFTPGFVYAEPNDLASVEALLDKGDCAAVMLECVQGEGGVLPLDAEFLTGVEKLCREKGALYIIDEVQTGNGRCGALYAYMNYGLSPDIITTAKGLGGGLPIGACMLGDKVQDTLTPGTHGSTFGGNPACCAGAISILSRLTDELMAEVRAKAEYITRALTGAPGVISVTGMGLMIGVEPEKPAKDVIAALIDKGVLALTAKHKVRLLPPLTIPWDELQTAVEILKEALV